MILECKKFWKNKIDDFLITGRCVEKDAYYISFLRFSCDVYCTVIKYFVNKCFYELICCFGTIFQLFLMTKQ